MADSSDSDVSSADGSLTRRREAVEASSGSSRSSGSVGRAADQAGANLSGRLTGDESDAWSSDSSQVGAEEDLSPIISKVASRSSDEEADEAVQRTLDFSAHTDLTSDDERPDMRDPTRGLDDIPATPSPIHTHTHATLSAGGSPLSNCHRITKYLQARGFAVCDLEDSDIDEVLESVPLRLLESWAAGVLGAVAELHDRVDSQRSAVTSASLAVRTNTASNDALQSRISDLQALVSDHEKRERVLQARVLESERRQLDGGKADRAAEADFKKKLKHLDAQVQEATRKLRAKEVDFDRLREKLATLTAKDREASKRSKELLQRVLATGDYSFLTEPVAGSGSIGSGRRAPPSASKLNTSALSAASGASGGSSSSRGQQSEEVLKAFEALDGHRRELSMRNKELELQVQDLLRSLQDAHNTSAPAPVAVDAQEDRADRSSLDVSKASARAKSPAEATRPVRPTRELLQRLSRGEQSGLHDADAQADFDADATGRFTTVLRADYHDMFLRLARQEEEITALTHRTLVQQADAAEQEQRHEHLRAQLREQHDALAQLRFELDRRPTVKEVHRLQIDLAECEQKLSALALHAGQAARVDQTYRRHLSTADSVRVDKLNHQLQLFLLDHLSKDMLLEAVKDVCRELAVSDVSFLLPTVQKLKTAVTAIPRMEKFIVHVSSYVLDRNDVLNEKLGLAPRRGSAGEVDDALEEVQAVLPRWWSLIQQSVELARFRETVLLELYRSQALLAHDPPVPRMARDPRERLEEQVVAMWRREGRAVWQLKDPPAVAQQLRELVDLQVEVLQHSAGRGDVLSYVQARPDLILNRIVRHVQYVFDIAHTDGIVAKLNSVYLQHEETANFLRAVRQALGKDAACSNAAVFADLASIISQHKLAQQQQQRQRQAAVNAAVGVEGRA